MACYTKGIVFIQRLGYQRSVALVVRPRLPFASRGIRSTIVPYLCVSRGQTFVTPGGFHRIPYSISVRVRFLPYNPTCGNGKFVAPLTFSQVGYSLCPVLHLLSVV